MVLKFISNYRVFSTKSYDHESFGPPEFRTIFRVAPKSIWGPCNVQNMRVIRKNTLQALVTSWKNGSGSYSQHRGKQHGIKRVRMVVQLHQLERLVTADSDLCSSFV